MGKGKKTKHDQRGKDNGEKARDAKPVAEAIIEEVKTKVLARTADETALGAKVKDLRDKGMAWWAIGYELGLPGSGPNVQQGKSGAARARAVYKKAFGELPGDVVQRSTRAARAAGTAVTTTVRKPVFTDAQVHWEADEADEEIIAKLASHEIRWEGRTVCSDGGTIVTEREARVHPDGVKIERSEDKRTTIHFREYEKGDHRHAQQWRSVYVADIYDIRR